MKKQSKKILKISGIILLILLLALFIRVPVASPVVQNVTSGGGSSYGGGGSGGSSTPTAPVDTPVIFIPFNWFGFDIPKIPEIPSITIPTFTLPSIPLPTTPTTDTSDTTPLRAVGDSCSYNAQCSSNICNLGNKAIGICEGATGRTTEIIPTQRQVPTDPLKADGSSCSSDAQCSSAYCELGNKAIGICKTTTARTSTFNCDDYRRGRGYDYSTTTALFRGTSCQSYAETQCSSGRLTNVISYQVTGESCCVWSC